MLCCHGLGHAACADDNGKGEALGLGCDFDKIPSCTRAKLDIDDFVSWDIECVVTAQCCMCLLPLMLQGYAFNRRCCATSSHQGLCCAAATAATLKSTAVGSSTMSTRTTPTPSSAPSCLRHI